jgi:pre-mRNA-processing factor 19
LATLKGHTKPVSSVVLSPTAKSSTSEDQHSSLPAFIASAGDKIIKLWAPTETASAKNAYKSWHHLSTVHTEDVIGLSLHPGGQILASCGKDGKLGLYDLVADGGEARTLFGEDSGVEVDKGGDGAVEFHPDGGLLGLGGGDGIVRIWDVKSGKKMLDFSPQNGQLDKVSSIAFSENGWTLAALSNASIQFFDLRKLSNFHTISIEPSSLQKIFFHPTGAFLTGLGKGASAWNNKTWDEAWKWDGDGSTWNGGGWNASGAELVVGGGDRSLRIWGEKKGDMQE